MQLGSFDNSPASLPQALARAALPTKKGRVEPGITMLDNRGRQQSERTFDEVEKAALAGAGRWRALGVKAGEPVLICLPTSWQFLDAWFGAVYLGALPVAIAPPGALGSPAAQVDKALAVCASIKATWLIAPQNFLDEAQRGEAEGRFDPVETHLIAQDSWESSTPDGFSAHDLAANPDPNQTAFLQLTSGSTGQPRAVAISHGALIHNAQAIYHAMARLDGVPYEHLVSWLPLYHDMGLIGCLSNSIVNQTPLDLLSPRSFLARPWVWLEAISRREKVMAPAPNFAYQMCVERVAKSRVQQLDLSSYQHILSGSEMVRPETVSAFLDHFAEASVDPARFRPCYGLAETTLAVTVDSTGASARVRSVGNAAATVALGTAVADNEIVILPPIDESPTASLNFDPAAALPEDTIGRVVVRSPSLMTGYYQDPEATAAVMQDGWLDTGDLGFLYQDELYLTGRNKEILILNGTNVMPHEIEWVAEGASAAGGSERCGAFSVLSERGEQPILVMETTAKDPDAIAHIKREVASAVGKSLSIPLTDLALVRRGSIPRTSSGKVQRRLLEQQYLAGQIDRIDEPVA